MLAPATQASAERYGGKMVALLDGRQVSTWSVEWLHECECRQVLQIPTLDGRRAYLYGKRNQWGTMAGGIEQRRGTKAREAMEATMMAIWQARRDAANDNSDAFKQTNEGDL